MKTRRCIFWIAAVWALALACNPKKEEPVPVPVPPPAPPAPEIAVESVALDFDFMALEEGSEATLKATVLPENATHPEVSWSSSDTLVAKVADGQVMALTPGKATVTARAGEKSALCEIVVEKRFIPVDSVALSPSALTLVEGEEAELKATVLPEDATDPSISWSSSDTLVARVADGKVKALKPGIATVTALSGEKQATCEVTVEKKFIPVSSVELDKASLTLVEGEEAVLSATVLPADATDPSVSWSSSDASVATVDGGKVKTLKPGKATITAKAGEKTATCEVTVEKRFIPVSSITLSQSTLTLVEGDEAVLSATVLPADATEPGVSWSTSDTSVATVEGGKVKTLKPGKTTITAKAGEKEATCEVTVEKKFIPVSSIALSQSALTLVEGDEAVLSATVLPADATDPSITWSTSDASVATVDGGKVKTLKPGKAIITAKAGEKEATCEVTVEKRFIPVSSVELSRSSCALVEGDEITLSATVLPADATDPSVTWSTSDASVATVAGGKVVAVKEGKATITAKAGEKEATCLVTVAKKIIPVSSVALDKTILTLVEGEEAVLSATVLPADATDPSVSWSSSDASVATVSGGQVKAVAPGKATVTARAGEKEATCTVTVEKRFIPVTSIALSQPSLTLVEGDEATLSATVLPADATEPGITWSTSDASVATVTDGQVKAVAPGKATITAKAGEKEATCAVTVEKKLIPATSITLDRTELTLLAEESGSLTATVKPSNTTDAVTWTSSNPSVASVYSGYVSALQVGETTITAWAGELSATCKVTVEYQFSISASEVTASGDGQEFTIKVKCPETYQVESMPEWITQVSVSGKIHRFKAVRNPARTERTGAVVFLDGRGTRLSCQVTQGGYVTEIADGGNEQVGEGEEIDW